MEVGAATRSIRCDEDGDGGGGGDDDDRIVRARLLAAYRSRQTRKANLLAFRVFRRGEKPSSFSLGGWQGQEQVAAAAGKLTLIDVFVIE